MNTSLCYDKNDIVHLWMLRLNRVDRYMKNLFARIFNRRQYAASDGDEFCPLCDANLTLQKGYCNSLPYWVCKGCGEMLINPRVDTETDIVWICDQCEAMLNEQAGFSENDHEWKCSRCGFINHLDQSNIYLSTDEYISSVQDPYNGMSDDDVIALMRYEEIGSIENHEDIILIQDEGGTQYVKKILTTYDENVYQSLIEHPIAHTPKIIGTYKGKDKLIVIEEYIDGVTISEILKKGEIDLSKAIQIVRDICRIVKEFHSLEQPIIHRDIKPSNVMISKNDEVFLLDVNVAKYYRPEETEDTRLLGTLYYAAPEQFGYGFSASTSKTDIYAIGILLNVMLTGAFPKEKRASGDIWNVIEKCIRLNPEDRYSDDELMEALNQFGEV